MLRAFWITIFYQCAWLFSEKRDRERESCRPRRKKYFYTVLRAKSKSFRNSRQALLRDNEKTTLYRGLKKKLKAKHAQTKLEIWTLALMFFSHEKCPSSRQIKCPILPRKTPDYSRCFGVTLSNTALLKRECHDNQWFFLAILCGEK